MELRKKYSTKKYTALELTKMYGIAARTLRHIIHRDTWKHI
jgi:hypothetical protein